MSITATGVRRRPFPRALPPLRPSTVRVHGTLPIRSPLSIRLCPQPQRLPPPHPGLLVSPTRMRCAPASLQAPCVPLLPPCPRALLPLITSSPPPFPRAHAHVLRPSTPVTASRAGPLTPVPTSRSRPRALGTPAPTPTVQPSTPSDSAGYSSGMGYSSDDEGSDIELAQDMWAIEGLPGKLFVTKELAFASAFESPVCNLRYASGRDPEALILFSRGLM
ncbi:hypothetical protein DFH06DRAFT_1350721 [Mycena polygramma]|nr:hypothetical protein DFH06DRAFT_1350721 [Mycena polygramma]